MKRLAIAVFVILLICACSYAWIYFLLTLGKQGT